MSVAKLYRCHDDGIPWHEVEILAETPAAAAAQYARHTGQDSSPASVVVRAYSTDGTLLQIVYKVEGARSVLMDVKTADTPEEEED